MDLDVTIHKGTKDKPVVILIHGLGMDKNFWLNPLGTKIFAKNIPLSVFTATKPEPCERVSGRKITVGRFHEDIRSLWTALKNEGFSLICWSQKRPVGPIHIVSEELVWITEMAKEVFPRIPQALIGHSRGGLAARKFMEKKRNGVKALITIASPHGGSSIARLGKYLEPFSGMLKKLLPKSVHNTVSETIQNVTNLLEGDALKELLPGAEFFRDFKDPYHKGVRYLSFGGSQPRLLTVYMWMRKGKNMCAVPLLSIPDSLVKIFPPFFTVAEIIPGKGDGLVTTESALLPQAENHYNVPANHVSIVWDQKTAEIILKTLGTI